MDGYVTVKETQKRHLPHAHVLFTLVAADKPRVPADIHHIVSAEIPDAATNPTLHCVVTSHMIHEPCGAHTHTVWTMESAKKTTQSTSGQTLPCLTGHTLYTGVNRKLMEHQAIHFQGLDVVVYK